MKWGTATVIIGVLALVCVALVLSVAYPFSTSDPHGPLWGDGSFSVGSDERFSVEDGEEYSVTASQVVDGETALTTKSVVTDDWKHLSWSLGGRSVSIYYAPDGTAYQRFEYEDDERADSEIRRIESDDERQLHGEERDSDGVTLLAVDERDYDVANAVSDRALLALGGLTFTEYERVESDGETYVYEPRNGWFDETEAYRTTDASGQVRVDADTDAVESANVSYTVTEDVETYARYVVDALTEEADQYTIETTYEFDEGDAEVDVPDWVETLRDGR